MSTKKVKVSYSGDNTLYMPAMEVPYPEPVRDVTRIVLNGFTTEGNSLSREFVPARKCDRVWYKPTRNYICSVCGAGMPKALDRHCYLNYCPHCGAKIEHDECVGK